MRPLAPSLMEKRGKPNAFLVFAPFLNIPGMHNKYQINIPRQTDKKNADSVMLSSSPNMHPPALARRIRGGVLFNHFFLFVFVLPLSSLVVPYPPPVLSVR